MLLRLFALSIWVVQGLRDSGEALKGSRAVRVPQEAAGALAGQGSPHPQFPPCIPNSPSALPAVGTVS